MLQEGRDILNNISIDVLVADDSPTTKMSDKVKELQPANHNIPVKFLYYSNIDDFLKSESDSIGDF